MVGDWPELFALSICNLGEESPPGSDQVFLIVDTGILDILGTGDFRGEQNGVWALP